MTIGHLLTCLENNFNLIKLLENTLIELINKLLVSVLIDVVKSINGFPPAPKVSKYHQIKVSPMYLGNISFSNNDGVSRSNL